MSDNLQIPAPAGRATLQSTYRTRRTAAEPEMRLLAIAAAVLGGLLLLGMGGWALMGRRPATVPVIEADSRPLRVKPDNPGGMQISAAEETALNGASDGVERLAPAPEAPAPQALRAQMQQTQPPAAAAPAPAAQPDAPAAAPSAAKLGGSPLPDTPSRAAARTPAAPAASPATSPAVAPTAPHTGAMQVQLAALDSEAAAQAEWQRLAKRMPDLLNDRRPVVQKAERDGHTVWRVRTGGFSDTAEATGFCVKVKAKGGSCTLASF